MCEGSVHRRNGASMGRTAGSHMDVCMYVCIVQCYTTLPMHACIKTQCAYGGRVRIFTTDREWCYQRIANNGLCNCTSSDDYRTRTWPKFWQQKDIVSKQTVWATITKYKTHGTLSCLPGSGRRFKLTPISRLPVAFSYLRSLETDSRNSLPS